MSGHYTKRNPPPKLPFREWGKGRTRQSEADACDVNRIVDRYRRTGVIPSDARNALFLDVSSVVDYRDALDRVSRAQEAFMQLPAKVRARFANDPAEFLDFCSDPANREEMKALGLMEEAMPVEPAEPPVKATDEG